LFHHPVVGDLHLEQHRLTSVGHPQLHLMIYTPVLTTDAPSRLRQLVDSEAPADVADSDLRAAAVPLQQFCDGAR
jgi:MmyB-like transcription regulator ligand binding domain